jgi:hypothetical protein
MIKRALDLHGEDVELLKQLLSIHMVLRRRVSEFLTQSLLFGVVCLQVFPDGNHFSGDEHHEIEKIVALLTVQVRAASCNLDGAT